MAKLKTGRHTSALKAHRQSVTHAEHNLQIRSKIRTLARRVEAAVAEDAKSAKTLLRKLFPLGIRPPRPVWSTGARLPQEIPPIGARGGSQRAKA